MQRDIQRRHGTFRWRNPVYRRSRMNSARLGTRTPNAWLAAVLAFVFGLAGCSTPLVDNKIDYKSASNVSSLELPPSVFRYRERRSRAGADRLRARGGQRHTAHARRVAGQRRGAAAALRQSAVAGGEGVSGSRMGRGEQVLDRNGYAIAVKEPALGIMETDWLETRASVPSDFVRRAVGNYADFFLNPYKRDKFRTRIEPGSGFGAVRSLCDHQGAEQLPGKANEKSLAPSSSAQSGLQWTPVRANAEVEAEMLSKLALAFSAKPAVEQAAAKGEQPQQPPRTRLTRNAEGAESRRRRSLRSRLAPHRTRARSQWFYRGRS